MEKLWEEEGKEKKQEKEETEEEQEEKQPEAKIETKPAIEIEELERRLEARFGTKLEGIRDGILNTTAELVQRLVDRIEALEKELHELKSKPEPEEPKTEEMIMGEEGKQVPVLSQVTKEVATGLRERGFTADDISKILEGSGAFIQGLAALMHTRQAPPAPDPFHEAGRAMFTAFAEAMTKGVARVLGRRVGEETLRPEEEEHE